MAHKLYKKVKQFVIDSFNKADKAYQIKHFIRTVYWLKKLKPDADETLLIAAVAHDIERAFRQKDMSEKIKLFGFADLSFLRPHEERGAEIIGEFLKNQSAASDFVERVKMLVSRHEEGGNDDQNILKDADSISFLENNISRFITQEAEKVGKEGVKNKIDWMLNRINSAKAKQISKQWYEEAIKSLDSY